MKNNFVNIFISSSVIYNNGITFYFSPLEQLDLINLLTLLLDVLLVIVPVLLSVAFMTIIERKQLAAHQRRCGPNTVGVYGVLQPFADALKLIFKENLIQIGRAHV